MENEIGKRIKARRNELHITQTQIQSKTSISTGNLSCIENGKYLPSTTALIELSKILDCSIDWILTGKSSLSKISVPLSEDQQELIETYNRLDRRGRHRIHTVIYEELDRIELKKENEEIETKNEIKRA